VDDDGRLAPCLIAAGDRPRFGPSFGRRWVLDTTVRFGGHRVIRGLNRNVVVARHY